MQQRIFRLTPLTPIHVGTGETMGPEEYFIDGNRLIRFNWRAVLISWGENQRWEFERRITAALGIKQLRQARDMLRKAAHGDRRFHLYEAALGQESAGELREADDRPDRRRGEVHLCCRNLHTAEALIPGSSIKGAIRTAIVNAGAADEIRKGAGSFESLIRQQLEKNRKTAWVTLEEIALNYSRSETERDPLRLLRVSDAVLPPSAVRVDRAVVRNRRGEEATRRIQLHVERLLSRADNPTPPRATVRISLALEWARNRPSPLPAPISWDFLREACNAFYQTRYQEEHNRFEFLQRPRPWVPDSLGDGAILLRLGRFSHFESLSVDKLRSGWRLQPKPGRPIEDMGDSRTVCLLDNGTPAPFGWVLLEPLQRGSR